MKPYEKYVPSGVEWIGDIPEAWEVQKLKYISNLRNVKTEDSELVYIALEHIESNTGRLLKKDDDESQPDAECLAFYIGDVLFCKLRPYLAKCVLSTFNGKCSSELLVLQSKIVLIPRYLFFVALSHGFLESVNSSTYGSKMPRANWGFIGNMQLPLPSPDTQTAIADFLDRETAKIDNIIKAKEALVERLKEKRTALITHAVTKGLDHNAKMKSSGVEWIGDIPEGWEVKKVKYLFSVYNGATPKSDNDDFWNGDIAWLTPADYSTAQKYIYKSDRQITEEGLNSCATKLVPAGSVIISNRAPIGTVCIAAVSLTTNQGCKSMVKKTNIDERYIYYFLATQSVQLNNLGKGTTFLELSNSDLSSFIVPLPNTEIQTAIANYLDTETAKIDATVEKTKSSIEKLKEYRTALISACVTGKIDVRDLHTDKEAKQ